MHSTTIRIRLCIAAVTFLTMTAEHELLWAQSGTRNNAPRSRPQRSYAPRTQPQRNLAPGNQTVGGSRNAIPRGPGTRTLLNAPSRSTTGIQSRLPQRPLVNSSTGLNPGVNKYPQDTSAVRLPRARSAGNAGPRNRTPNALRLPDIDFAGANVPLPLRRWQDNTGTYSTEARLTAIRDNKLKLLKQSGKTTTVPLRRLSHDDQLYVRELIVMHNGST